MNNIHVTEKHIGKKLYLVQLGEYVERNLNEPRCGTVLKLENDEVHLQMFKVKMIVNRKTGLISGHDENITAGHLFFEDKHESERAIKILRS